MLPPVLRIRFCRLEAFPICSLRSVPTASVVKGTKMQPVPKPASMFARTTLLIVICKLNRHKRKLASPTAAKPSPASRRESTRPTNAPTKNSATNAPDSAWADA